MMEHANSVKVAAVAVCSFIFAKFGALGPILVVLTISLLGDYATGLVKAGYQKKINSRIGLWGIVKKLLYLGIVAVAMGVDWLIAFLAGDLGIAIQTVPLFSILVAVWMTVNEWISILENITSVIGKDKMPKFLMPIIQRLKMEVEEKADAENGEEPTEKK